MSIRIDFPLMLRKLWRYWFSAEQAKTDTSTGIRAKEIDNIHSISVILHPDDAVDIVMMHPDLELLSISDISSEAEKFAELLVYVTNPLMEPKLLATINHKAKISERTKEQLFYDNVISYYQLIRSEYEKRLINNGPVIRPRSAFSLR